MIQISATREEDEWNRLKRLGDLLSDIPGNVNKLESLHDHKGVLFITGSLDDHEKASIANLWFRFHGEPTAYYREAGLPHIDHFMDEWEDISV